MSNIEHQKKRTEKFRNNREYEDDKKKRAEQRRLSRKKAKDLMTTAQKEQHEVKTEIRAKITQATKKVMSNNFSFCCH